MIPLSLRYFKVCKDHQHHTGHSHTKKQPFLLLFTLTFPYQYLINTYINADKKSNTIFSPRSCSKMTGTPKGNVHRSVSPKRSCVSPGKPASDPCSICLSYRLRVLPEQFCHLSTHYFLFLSNYLQCLWLVSSYQSSCF